MIVVVLFSIVVNPNKAGTTVKDLSISLCFSPLTMLRRNVLSIKLEKRIQCPTYHKWSINGTLQPSSQEARVDK